MQLLEDFGESQEDIFHQLMELGSKSQRVEELKRVEELTIPDSNSTEQNEPQPYPNDGLEVRTTPRNPSEDGGTEEQRPDDGLRHNELSPDPQRQVPDSVPPESTLSTLHEEDNTETDAPAEHTNEAPMDLTHPLGHAQ